MKFQVKTINGKVDSVEAEADCTLIQLQDLVANALEYNPEGLRIVRKGQIVQPTEQTIGDAGFQDDEILVVVGKKRPAEEAGEAEGEGDSEAKRQRTDDSYAPHPLLVTAEMEAQVGPMVEMGFSREKVIEALRAAYNDANRAVEYLINGIPADIALPQTDAQMNANEGEDMLGDEGQEGEEGEEGADGEDDEEEEDEDEAIPEFTEMTQEAEELINTPEFMGLRQAVQANNGQLPEDFESSLQALATAHPQLQEYITNNVAGIQQLLQLQIDEEGDGADGDDDDEGDEEGAEDEGEQELTEQEEQAVDTLVALGFTREAAIAAYITCGKNEQLAASYLFEMSGSGSGFGSESP